MKRQTGILRFSILFTMLLIPFSLCLGRYPLSLNDLFQALVRPADHAREAGVLFDIRLPRVLGACLVGGSLSLAGSVMQNVFHNPIATPDVLGTSSGACFGAALAMLLGLASGMVLVISFFTGLLPVLAVAFICKKTGGSKQITMILAGMVIGSLFTAGTSCVKLLADQDNRLPAITYWMMGTLSAVSFKNLLIACIPALPASVLLFCLRYRLNALQLSDEEAKTIGVSVQRLRGITLLCAGLLTAAAVSLGGLIGWVGLVIPNLCRRLTGSDCRRLLPLSFFVGAAYLLLMDNLARTLLTVEIPIGILTAMIGAPMFLIILFRKEDAS